MTFVVVGRAEDLVGGSDVLAAKFGSEDLERLWIWQVSRLSIMCMS